MKHEQKFMILRYSNSIVHDCISQHKGLINSLGYCWFGKIGNIPSEKILHAVYAEKDPCIVLYKKGDSYLCQTDGYSTERPEIGYPEYYDTEVLNPSVYFRLTSIEKCNDDLFKNSVVISTGNFAEDALYHSRIPFTLCKYEDERLYQRLPSDQCRYNREGFCTNRVCVSYNCYCERPSSCMKQRR